MVRNIIANEKRRKGKQLRSERLRRVSQEEIIQSLADEHIISKESLDDFHQKLHHPDPKRVAIRRKTLERAKKIFEKHREKNGKNC